MQIIRGGEVSGVSELVEQAARVSSSCLPVSQFVPSGIMKLKP